MGRWDTFRKAITAGLAISIGAAVYLSCANKVVGATLFAVGLFAICAFGLNLFTGKIGYVIDTRNKPDCLVIWLGNFTGCLLGGGLLRVARPALSETAAALVQAKLTTQEVYTTAILGFFCGILMYIAVDNYKNHTSGFARCLGIFVCVPTFILCGFEHSVADMAYFVMGVNTPAEAWQAFLFLLVVSVANGIGALAFHYGAKSCKAA